jgi:hypothetical protein
MASNRNRWAGPAALLAGLLYITQAVVSLVRPQAEIFTSGSDYLIEALFVAALLLTPVGLAGLYQCQGGRSGRLGRVGFLAASFGATAMAVSATVTLAAGYNALGLLFVLGLLTTLTGQIAFGIAVVRAKTLRRWCGAALIAGLVVSLLLAEYGGGVVLGCAWVALGYTLWSNREAAHTSSAQPAHAQG